MSSRQISRAVKAFTMLVLITVAGTLVLFLSSSLILGQSDTEILRQLFDANCQYPCYLGLDVKVSTRGDIEADLQQQNIPYIYDSGLLQWFPLPRQGVTGGPSVQAIAVTIENDLVLQVMAPINVSVDAVIDVFGAPTFITDEMGIIYSLAYPDLGMSFFVDERYDASKVVIVVSSFPNNAWSIGSNPPGEVVTQTCLNFGTPPCIAPTATPTAAFKLTSTPVPPIHRSTCQPTH